MSQISVLYMIIISQLDNLRNGGMLILDSINLLIIIKSTFMYQQLIVFSHLSNRMTRPSISTKQVLKGGYSFRSDTSRAKDSGQCSTGIHYIFN